jgi:N-acetylmuramoyl-L-alanine amidase
MKNMTMFQISLLFSSLKGEREMYLNILKLLLILGLLLPALAFAKQSEVMNARIWESPESTRLVLELSDSVEYRVLTLSKPDRIVIDITNAAKHSQLFSSLDLSESPLSAIRTARRNQHDLRIVLDLKEKVEAKSFLLKPNQQYKERLVFDLISDSKKSKSGSKLETKYNDLDIHAGKRDIVIVIDPGHGGEDPGAIGPNGLREKQVVLAVSKALKDKINAQKGFKAVLTRESDYYVGLRERMVLARKFNADLLISVHADAFTKPQAKGASVYALSTRGATSEMARWLAKKENSADLIGGIDGLSLDDKDDVLAGVLLDLSSTASLTASLGVGSHVLSSMSKMAHLHKKTVQQAGFVVLKSPDIPSILVETGFISNPTEAQRLKSSSYQKQLADSIHKGVIKYFETTPPPGTLIAWLKQDRNKQASNDSPIPVTAASNRGAANTWSSASVPYKKYIVRRGDTLSLIAAQNQLSMNDIKSLNGLSSDRLKIGQGLKLPAG